MIYRVKGIAVNRPFVIKWQGIRGGEAFYSPVIRCQSFSEPVSLNCELHVCLTFVEQDG